MSVKELPILFSAPMVRALLAGTKTQTRRIVKPARRDATDFVLVQHDGEWWPWESDDGESNVLSDGTERVIRSPFGTPGSRLWVCETFYAFGRWETRYSEKKGRDEWHFVDVTLAAGKEYHYDADAYDVVAMSRRSGLRSDRTPCWWKRPAIFMPRAASRIVLEVTSVRVQRLQDISEHDAAAEGVTTWAPGALSPEGQKADPSDQFRWLWTSINGDASWYADPWVWALEFRKLP